MTEKGPNHNMDQTQKLDSIQDLMEEILKIQHERLKDVTVVQKVEDIIKKSSELVEETKSTSEILVDAKILNTGIRIVDTVATTIDTNLTGFNENEYVAGLLSFIANASNQTDNEKAWQCLAPEVYPIFRKFVPQRHVLGSLCLKPQQAKERVRKERQKKDVEPKRTLVEERQSDVKDSGSVDENIIEIIMRSLIRCFKANNRKPISFLEFIIDPNSYWGTVENIFYCSFLFKDGYAKLSQQKGYPVIEPIKAELDKNTFNKERVTANHFVFTLTKDDWKMCVEKFEIKVPKIKRVK